MDLSQWPPLSGGVIPPASSTGSNTPIMGVFCQCCLWWMQEGTLPSCAGSIWVFHYQSVDDEAVFSIFLQHYPDQCLAYMDNIIVMVSSREEALQA